MQRLPVFLVFPQFRSCAAAALLLRAIPEAEIIITSTDAMPHKVRALADRAAPVELRILASSLRWANDERVWEGVRDILACGGAVICYADAKQTARVAARHGDIEWVIGDGRTLVESVIEHARLPNDAAARRLVRIARKQHRDREAFVHEDLVLLVESAVSRLVNQRDGNALRRIIPLLLMDPADLDTGMRAEIERHRRYGHRRLSGRSQAMARLRSQIAAAAQSPDARVLIRGESGTGKETVAWLIHAASPRRDEPFAPLNCAALPESLIESLLFGHTKGAFTGADRAEEGMLKAADGGTVFLDEIAELPLPAQAKLLRVLQEGRFVPLGATAEVDVDVRIIAATHRNLRKAVADGRFREDLYYRLNVIPLHVPALRDRSEDIPDLADEIMWRLSRGKRRLTPSEHQALQAYTWPGNVRQLENVLERMVVLRLPHVREALAMEEDGGPPDDLSLDAIERAHILRVFRMTRGNRSRTARLLGISRNTLKARLERYEAEANEGL